MFVPNAEIKNGCCIHMSNHGVDNNINICVNVCVNVVWDGQGMVGG